MNIQKVRDRIQEKIEKSAWTLAGLKKYERLRVELVVFAFLTLAGIIGIISSVFYAGTFRVITYSFISAMAFITFLGKAVQFKQFYILSRLSALREVKGGIEDELRINKYA